ncbi:MAG TPA: MBL fold metallo-hydrolase [Longimicrobiaceae bacterium]|jgi:glyoxylase-like metal-dependent hydrolase (beta-lactamase superfamily II)|nr:MBL fold metallo-hydrolase [Longimicrobiaceae bacterium]
MSGAVVVLGLMQGSHRAAAQAGDAGRGSGTAVAEGFDVQRIGRDVYAVIRREPESLAVQSNSVFIVRERDVVVVDAQFTRAATSAVIGALRRITPKPVRYVVNTHWHDDHTAGNQVYRERFPGVEFIAHENTRADLATLGRDNRTGQVEGIPAFLARLRRLMAQGLGADSTAISPSERAALTSASRIGGRYVAEAPGFRETLPTIAFRDRLVLTGGGRTVVLRWFGRGNTRGDAVVWLPDEKIVATGDLVVAPVPFAFNSYPAEWIAALDSVAALGASTIVPGHGPVMHDDSYVVRVARMLTAICNGTASAKARGETAEQAAREVTLEADRRAIAGDDKWMNVLFRQFFLAPAVARAYAEAPAPH